MNKELLRLAIPNIVSNISVPILSTVDTALMGMLSPLHIGAVGLASMIFNFIYWNFGFLRMGTTGMTAQAFGNGNQEEIIDTLARSLGIGLILALLLITFQNPLLDLGIGLMNVPTNQIELVSTYFKIRIWAAPASLFLYCFLGWYFGMQNALYPLIITIGINIINIVLSYYFIAILGWSIEGVAWSTVIAQYSGLILSVIFVLYKYRELLDKLNLAAIWTWSKIKSFARINSNLFIRTICLTFSFGYFYSQSAKLGVDLLAVNVILLQYVNWLSYAIDGFAFAAESVVGKYAGAMESSKVGQAIKKSFLWGGSLSIFFALIYLFFGNTLLHLFTDDPEVIRLARSFMFWMWIIPIASFASYIWDGIFIGLTSSRAMRNTMIFSLIVFITYYSMVSPGINQLWMAMTIFLLARGLSQTILYLRFGQALK